MYRYVCQNCGSQYFSEVSVECRSCGSHLVMVNDNNYSKKDKTKEMRMAEFNAWKALANSNFGQFGFWAEVWANLNITSSVKMKDPFSIINDFAKKKLLKT